MSPPQRKTVELVALALILALAAWVRVTDYPQVFAGGELLPQIDGDSHFHLHRALRILDVFPHVPRHDPDMNWPAGATALWADGFDLGAAALALACGGRGDGDRARLAIALWPVVLGLLMIVATMRLVRVVAPGAIGRRAALAAGVVGALLPGSVVSSALGRVDHHVFEMLLMVLLAGWALGRVGGPGRAPPSPLRFELEGAAVAALGLYGFTGAPLYLALVLPPLSVAAWRDGRVHGSGAWGLLLGGLLGAALYAPAFLHRGELLTFVHPSLFQPLLVMTAGGWVAACAWVGKGARPGRRLLLAAAIAVTGAVASAVCWPSVWRELAAGLGGWLLHRDPWLATIDEFLPYLRAAGGLGQSVFRISVEFAWPGYLLPLAALLLLFSLRGARVRWLLFVTAALVAVTLAQNRFSRPLAPFVAATTGLALAVLVSRLARAFRPGRALVVTPVLAGALLLLDGSPRAFLAPSVVPRRKAPEIEAALDLRTWNPTQGRRGVLSNWGYGHQLQYLGGVPVVVNGFGRYLDEAEFWRALHVFEGSAAGLDAYVDSHRIGAIVAGVGTLGYDIAGAAEPLRFDAGKLDQGYMRRLPLSPVLIAGSAVPAWDVPHLAHLLPRFASSARVPGLAFPLPMLWTYEVVPGARVVGRASPGARVVAELAFVEHRWPHRYKAWGRAGADGRWEIVLPFPSAYFTPTLWAPTPWQIGVEGASPVPVQVPEAAVRAGAVVEVGILPGAGAAAVVH